MGFMFDGLDAEAYDRNYTDRQLVDRILSYFKPQSRRIGLAAVAVFCISALDTLLPITISRTLDMVQQNPTPELLLGAAGLLILIASTSWIFTAIRQTVATRAVGDVVLKLREDTADAVLKRDMSFYDQFQSGKVVSRVTSDTQAFSQVMVLSIDLLSRLLLVVLLVGYLFTISAKLATILLILAPFIVGAALAFRRIARTTITSSRRINATVNAHIQETVSGIGVAKTFRQEPAIYNEFVEVNEQSRHINLRTRYVFSSIFPIMNLLAGCGTAALVYFGVLTVRAGGLSAGSWFLFIQGLVLFWFPLTSIASFWSQFQIGLAAGERVFGLIDAEPRVVQKDKIKLGRLRGDIRFEKVWFSYVHGVEAGHQGAEVQQQLQVSDQAHDNSNPQALSSDPSAWVLKDFDLHIRPGELLALVGHTGSGKSSITKLIARFYEFQGGRILIDETDIRSLDLAAYRAQLGIVTQTPFLFDGTVRENIRYGKPGASDLEVQAVAQAVGGGDWIHSLPNGLNSEVGERGAALSMGQRQLIALARVLLQNPAIVMMDEATASVDPLTEALIQEGLDIVLEGRTAIVIAHRLSTVRHADRIVVLKQGAIMEQGSHDALMASAGHYAELYNTYFRHQSLEYIERRAA